MVSVEKIGDDYYPFDEKGIMKVPQAAGTFVLADQVRQIIYIGFGTNLNKMLMNVKKSGSNYCLSRATFFGIVINPDPLKGETNDDMDTISFSVWYSSDCYQTYHNIGNWVRPIEGLSIKKIAENEWRIFVNQSLYVRESYCEEVPTGKGKSKKTKREIYTPLAATGDFNFQMDWIKNPVQ